MDYAKASQVPRRQHAQRVDLRSRKAMAAFLAGHFRYPTANSWNLSTSYACNMKITHMGLPAGIRDNLLDLAQTDEFYGRIRPLMDEFAEWYGYGWQAGWNGRSGGYLVLYQGGKKTSEYKSVCTRCGQRNYRPVTETGTKCGRCGADARVDFTVPPVEIFVHPGKGTDCDEDYESFMEWSSADLKDRVRLVCDFDKLADRIASKAIQLALKYEVRQEEILVPRTRAVMAPKGG